ncbi:cortactin-binding protein 2-like [Penaeus indicus]|uniref:cortactin-binding protein 2-like n=1 Tax=Penaeus indicus TaxID=29960 RepID=UPI00300DA8FD
MSGPSGGVLAVGHPATAPAGRGSKGALGEGGRRGSGDDPHRDGGGGRVQEGEAPRQNDASSVYTSSSYAASRGLRRPSAGRTAASPPQVAHPVPPPRSKGALSSVPGVAAPGIMKSSSEIFISSTALPPTKGILKSSSGVFRPAAPGAPLSRSASGGVVTSTARVNFSSTVSHIESSPPTSPTEPPFGPGGWTAGRQTGECDSAQKPQLLPQQRDGPQVKEGQFSQQHRLAVKISENQLQQQKLQRQKELEKNESKGTQHIKLQQQWDAEALEAKKLRQHQLQREADEHEALKQQLKLKQQQQLQKSAHIDIPETKQRREEVYFVDQHSQQLIRAGSLGSGEPAAILQQRRSRSPLPSPTPARSQAVGSERPVVPPIIHASNREATVKAPEERKNSLTNNSLPPGLAQFERNKKLEKSSSSPAIRTNESIDVARGPPTTILQHTGSAAVDARTGVIRAAAKAYTENFQSYSYSSYLTKNRKDSASAKDAPVIKDSLESQTEGKACPPASSPQEGNNSKPSSQVQPPAPAQSPSGRPLSRSTEGKIIVPLTSFTPGKTPEAVAASEKSFGKAPITGDKDCIIPKPAKPEAAKGGPASAVVKPPGQAVEQLPSKSQTQKEQATSAPQLQQQPQTRGQPLQKGPVSSASSAALRNTPAPAVPPAKKLPKTLPPLLSGFKFPLTGDRMKGSSEGTLLMACRVAEEDQIVKLLKELTATSALDATALNQADRSGRTSLSYCCANAYLRVVETLTSMPGIDINKPDTDGNTPLHFAAQAGHTEVVSHLVNKCNRSVDLDARNALGFTPLMKAALQGRTKIAKILLFAGASPHLRDFGRGLCAVEWARYTGRHVCSELIDSVQKSCSSHIRDRWTSDPDLKSHSSSSLNALGQPDNKESWIKHKIKKAFHKSESKKEFSVVTNLSTMAVCATSPLLPTAVSSQDLKPHQVVVPHVQVTEVKVPDCYEDPEDALSRLPPSPPPPLPAEEAASTTKSSKKSSKSASASGSSSTAKSPSSPSSATPAAGSSAAEGAAPPEEAAKEAPTDSKTNGTAKTIVSSSKLPFSSTKKRK